jgi:molecular chaperone DnaK (HSP70)
MGFTVGIDLGTTNSVVAIKKVGIAIIHNAEGEELTHSCVTCLKTNEVPDFIVGRESVNLAKQYP